MVDEMALRAFKKARDLLRQAQDAIGEGIGPENPHYEAGEEIRKQIDEIITPPGREETFHGTLDELIGALRNKR